MGQCLVSKLYGDFFFGGGEGENCGLSLHFTDLKTPVICPLTALPCSQLPGFCKQTMWRIQMHSMQRDQLHVGCWRRVGEAQSLLLKWTSSFILADLSCRQHRIHLYILPEPPLSSIFSRRPSRQTLSKAFVRSKKTEATFFFLERHSLSLGQ